MAVIREPERETPVVDECEVLVVGGGPAGVTAAAAAREGRAISADPPRGMHKIRPIPHCLVTGQAAGCAAALAVETGRSARELDVAELRRRLAAQGAFVELAPGEGGPVAAGKGRPEK